MTFSARTIIDEHENEDMIRNSMRPLHAGEIFRKELEELSISAKVIARELGVPQNRISDILRWRRGITADTALHLARYFNTTPLLWLNLQ